MKSRFTAFHAIVVAAGLTAAAIAVSVEQGELPELQALRVPATESGVRHTRVRLKTGVELDVAEAGPSNGEPILFLHGYTDSWFSYSRVLDKLPKRYRAIAPSQRGHGDSERPDCCYRITDFAADGVALLDALGINSAVVVGHSMGSFVAQRIAIDHPDRVKRLVLIGSGTTLRQKAVLEFNDAVQTLKDPIDTAFARDFQVSTVSKPLPSAFLDRVVGESMKLPARVWRDVLTGLLAGDAKDDLRRITPPTLLVAGERDAYWDRTQQGALQREIRGARLVSYADVGHSPHWEDPALIIKDLQAFLSEPNAATVAKERDHGAGHDAAHGAAGHGVASTDKMALLQGLGTWRHRITTASPDAQRYFDQGLALTYGFNHDAAARSFEQAASIDPSCAMCYWGIAYAVGPNINLPLAAAVEPRALAAVRKAQALANTATPVERALIGAMATRFGEPAGAARAARDSAYARAMRDVARQFPRDIDAQVLSADAMMNLRPWAYWTRDGQPQPGTIELVAALDRALALEPNHAGGCHFYVHAVEASNTPDRALGCAERLPRLMPGAGHVVHMPAHVYLRVGRYEDAARANIAAVEADHRYFAGSKVAPGVYPMFYAPHNLHFLWATYMLSGQRGKALNAARTLEQRVAVADAKNVASLEAFLVAPVLTLARFREWKLVLAEPAPPAELRYVTGMWRYARGLAHAGLGNVPAARAELDSVRALAKRVPNDMVIILNPAPATLNLAAEVLAGEIAVRQSQPDVAIEHLRAAERLEDALTFDEPPAWYHSARNILGETLLLSGRAAEAETAFREDLRFVRETGWSLSGLERALRAQGESGEASEVARRLEKAWKYADTPAHITSH